MAHARRGERAEALRYYDLASTWTDRNNALDGELKRFQAEAARLLSMTPDGKPWPRRGETTTNPLH